jgi:hypothetical protein
LRIDESMMIMACQLMMGQEVKQGGLHLALENEAPWLELTSSSWDKEVGRA